jgi:hypothetical protein
LDPANARAQSALKAAAHAGTAVQPNALAASDANFGVAATLVDTINDQAGLVECSKSEIQRLAHW